MKHNDKSLQSDNSARLDALLSDFLNKEIVVSPEQQSSSHPTGAPLGDLFADVGSAGKPPEQASSMQTPATQKVAPVNRTDVWESTNRTGSLVQSQSGLENLAADRLEKEVNSVLEASEGSWQRQETPSGFGCNHSRAGGWSIDLAEPELPEFSSSLPKSPPSIFRQVRWTRHPRPRLYPRRPVFLRLNLDLLKRLQQIQTPAVMKGARSLRCRYRSRPQLPPRLLQRRAFRSPSLKTPRNFKECPPPRCSVQICRWEPFRTFQPSSQHSRLAPLPLPPNPVSSAVKQAVPEAIRTTTATPALPVTKVQPIYPELAKRMKVTGTVHVAIVVDTTGKVISAKAVDGATVLRGSAALAVKQWRFRPATMNGAPVTGTGTVSVVFSPDRY